jgi:hypothetical protein
MVTVKNRLNGPLVCNVPDQDAVYFGPKEIKDLTHEQYNAPEIQGLIKQGYIIVLKIS